MSDGLVRAPAQASLREPLDLSFRIPRPRAVSNPRRQGRSAPRRRALCCGRTSWSRSRDCSLGCRPNGNRRVYASSNHEHKLLFDTSEVRCQVCRECPYDSDESDSPTYAIATSPGFPDGSSSHGCATCSSFGVQGLSYPLRLAYAHCLGTGPKQI